MTWTNDQCKPYRRNKPISIFNHFIAGSMLTSIASSGVADLDELSIAITDYCEGLSKAFSVTVFLDHINRSVVHMGEDLIELLLDSYEKAEMLWMKYIDYAMFQPGEEKINKFTRVE